MPITVTQLLGFVLALVLAAERRLWRQPGPVLWYLVAFLAVFAFTTILYLHEIPAYRGDAIQKIYSLLQFVLLYYISYCLFSREEAQRQFVFATFIGSLVISGLGILRIGTTERFGRVSFSGLDENAMGSLIAIGVVSALYYSTAKTSVYSKGLSLLGLGCMVWFIVLTGSRGSMLAAAAGILAFALKSRRPMYWFGGAMALTMLIWGISVSDVALDRWDRTRIAGDTANRDTIFRESIELIKERPLMGRGDVNSYSALGFRMGQDELGHHNEILWVLNSTGLVGGLFALLAVAKVASTVWHDRRSWRQQISMAFFVLLFVTSMSVEFHQRKIAWILVAFLMCGDDLAASRKTVGVKKRLVLRW